MSSHAKNRLVPGPEHALNFHPPPRAATVGLYWALGGIVLMFVWLTYGYLVARAGSDAAPVRMPVWFWFSTFPLLVASVTLHWSYLSAKARRMTTARRAAGLSLVLGLAFIVLQAPGLVELVTGHRAGRDTDVLLYRLILIIIALHAAHILAGAAFLVRINLRMRAHPAHHPRLIRSLLNVGLYWHVLAIIWLILFGAFLNARGVVPFYGL